MKSIFKISTLIIFSIWSNITFSAVNLNIKIGQVINNQIFEVKKTVSADFNKEVVIQDESLKNRIVLTLKKIKNVLVNGNKIEPVQINLKTVNNQNNKISKTQTITSFYTNEANFKIASNDTNYNDLLVDVEFSEIY